MPVTRRFARGCALALPAVWPSGRALRPGHMRARIAGNFATEHSSSVAIEGFRKEVEALTCGRLLVDTFAAMQLGGAGENISNVRQGTLPMTWVGMAFRSRTVPELEAISLPFRFASCQVAFRVVDGPVGELLDQRMADKGFLSLGSTELGLRHVTIGNTPIRSVDDLRGLKIRMQPNETQLAAFRAIVANPVAMDIRKLASALQQGVVDGQRTPRNHPRQPVFRGAEAADQHRPLLRLHLDRGAPARPSGHRRRLLVVPDRAGAAPLPPGGDDAGRRDRRLRRRCLHRDRRFGGRGRLSARGRLPGRPPADARRPARGDRRDRHHHGGGRPSGAAHGLGRTSTCPGGDARPRAPADRSGRRTVSPCGQCVANSY